MRTMGFMTPPAAPDLLSVLRRAFGEEPIRHIEHLPPRAGRSVQWPTWVPESLLDALRARGITRPWSHQIEAAELAYAGRHVVLCTGTASGKSLAYQLPVLSALLTDPKACALYLSPTKALGADQRESVDALGLTGVRAAPYDGDTALADRAWARDHGRLLLTNPDMLHLGILPLHARWARVLRNLRFVVVDECHSYRGVFGSHVALVLRRLRRIAELYGSRPVFVLASATVAEPEVSATRLVGALVEAVTEDGSPHPGADFALWEPRQLPSDAADSAATDAGTAGADGNAHDDTRGDPLDDPWAADDVWGSDPGSAEPEATNPGSDTEPLRRSAANEAARIMATLVGAGARTLTFVRSRSGAEQVAVMAARALGRTQPALAEKIAAYRGGYLPEDRRALERAFDSGELAGVASTNALELGVDIAGIDATVLAGYPGTLASLWQQAGRAGRGETPALITFIARDDPLDSYLVHHPEAVFARPVEAAVIDPTNPYVLTGHLACAAAELRLTDEDVDIFGGAAAAAALDHLLAERVLRRRPAGYFFADRHHPAAGLSLRGAGQSIAVVEGATGHLLGTENLATAPARIHPGAVYLHQGNTYVVRELDFDSGVALVDADRPDWWTSARSISSVEIRDTEDSWRPAPGVTIATGTVTTTEQVVGYVRRRGDGTLIDTIGLDMPEQTLDTRAVWYTVEPALLDTAGVAELDIPGALHAAEHAAIGLLPLFAGCDRWDIGGLSSVCHSDTGLPTVVIYDGYPGGAGFAGRGFEVISDWLAATRDAVASCPCAAGCPSCIQSPKCGNGNHPLHKSGAVSVLDVASGALAAG